MEYVQRRVARAALRARARARRAHRRRCVAIAHRRRRAAAGSTPRTSHATTRGQPLGIVHRDVSPQNILVGIDGIARVLDFGVAHAEARLSTTGDGQLKGKLAYMCPSRSATEP